MRKEILRLEHIYKSIHGFSLLSNFNMNVYEGEIFGVLGHSREDKEALGDILSGAEQVDSGAIYLYDKKVSDPEILEGRESGIFYAGSKSSLFSNMTIAENFYLTDIAGSAYYSNKQALRSTQSCLDELGIEFKASMLVKKLAFPERRLIQIAMAYYAGANLIVIGEILDEPLTDPKYKDSFLSIMTKLRQKGISFVLMTPSAFDAVYFCDRLLILSNGTDIKTFSREEYDFKQICNITLGAYFYENQVAEHTFDNNKMTRFCIRANASDNEINFEAGKGEVAGIIDYGNEYVGELTEYAKPDGRPPPVHGEMDGKPFSFGNLHEAFDLGIGFIFGGAFPNQMFNKMDTRFNVTVEIMQKIDKKYGLFSDSKKMDILLEDHGIKDFCGQKILPADNRTLSTVDRQKVLMCRWLVARPKVLVCINPYSHFLPELINLTNVYFDKLAQNGTTIIIMHNYLPVITPLYDRLIFVNQGVFKFQVSRDELTDPYFFMSQITRGDEFSLDIPVDAK